jgi:hypothetical protein
MENEEREENYSKIARLQNYQKEWLRCAGRGEEQLIIENGEWRMKSKKNN